MLQLYTQDLFTQTKQLKMARSAFPCGQFLALSSVWQSIQEMFNSGEKSIRLSWSVTAQWHIFVRIINLGILILPQVTYLRITGLWASKILGAQNHTILRCFHQFWLWCCSKAISLALEAYLLVYHSHLPFKISTSSWVLKLRNKYCSALKLW